MQIFMKNICHFCTKLTTRAECVDRLFKKLSIPIFTQIHPVGVEMFRADKRRDKHGCFTIYSLFASSLKMICFIPFPKLNSIK
jgi:hypothetical protein